LSFFTLGLIISLIETYKESFDSLDCIKYKERQGSYYGKIIRSCYGVITLCKIRRYGAYGYKAGKTTQEKRQFKTKPKFWFVLIMETELEKGWHITPKGKPNYLRVRKMSPLILEVTLTTNHTIIMI
jgi:hypothetical protein